MIKNLDELAPGKYREMYGRFKEIQERVNPLLAERKSTLADRMVYPLALTDKEMADQVGSKMANLGEMRNRLGLRVPNGFVISSLAYRRFMEHNDLQAEIDRRLQASEGDEMGSLYSLSADIQQLIIRSPLPDDLHGAIMEAYAQLQSQEGRGVTVSLRSSALAEDTAGVSFAGQYRSMLNVSADNLVQSYKEILASKYSVPAMAYRFNRGIRDEDVAMCVGCMVMIQAVSGGVTYSRNPLDIRDQAIYINSVWGLPKSVVDGSVTPDLFAVSRDAPMAVLRKEVRLKDRKFVCYPEEGVCRLDLTGGEGGAPSLTDEQALGLASMAVRLESYYGAPQDMEWAISPSGDIHLLQCRPLQQRDTGERRSQEERETVDGARVLLRGGVTASPGVGFGPVFLARKEADSLRFPHGAVLVAVQASPRWAALLNRAAAVVTEQGSVTGHLANVAREFGVPALFGLPGAMERLGDGELVTVDADGQRICRDRVDSLLEASTAPRNLMEGSPVHEILKCVSRHIIPLHLLNPDAPDFLPKRCRTFHDITRFCHEKSVHEMFNFGKEHHFPERSSKQLVCEVPMQWWVLNLDDGFREEVEGRQVRLENIASLPMLALWEGITAVPWQGPPPVDAKGFMSVMIQATTNPALDPAMRSAYANRNYFMISRNFCSLSSRFGFHFSTIETLVSDRPGENYISFLFKGGAADYQRRMYRAVFISRILESFGFRVGVKEDAVLARIEGREEGFMRERLRILGYLIIHTRQLDMVMANGSSTAGHMTRIMNDLKGLVTDDGDRGAHGDALGAG
jgi:pyruvate,water dikinase